MLVRKAVHGLAVHDELPVRPSASHLIGECDDVVQADVRVRCAMAGEYLRRDGAWLGGLAGGEAAVNAHDSGQVRARPRQRPRGLPADAEAAGRPAVASFRAAGKGGPAGLAAADEERRGIAQGGEARRDPFAVARDAVAVHVAREYGVAEFRVAMSLLSRVPVEAGTAVDEHYPGPRAGLRFVPAEQAGQPNIEVVIEHLAGRDLRARSGLRR